MIGLPQEVIDAFKSQVAFTCILLEFDLIDVNDQPYSLFYTDADVEVVYNEVVYKPTSFTIGNFSYSSGSKVDSLQITFDNVSLLPVSIFLNKEQRGRTAVVRFCALDSEGRVIGAYEVFRGFINKIEIREQAETSTAEIEITHELATWNKSTLRVMTYRCPWRFKDSNCGYTGAETWCDKTYQRCQALGNTANFGGFPHLAEIEEKEIWWGRKPK